MFSDEKYIINTAPLYTWLQFKFAQKTLSEMFLKKTNFEIEHLSLHFNSKPQYKLEKIVINIVIILLVIILENINE